MTATENPVAAAPSTPPRIAGWIASVSAGVAVLLLVGIVTAASVAMLSAVDREEMVEYVDRQTGPMISRSERLADESAETKSILIEVRTKLDLLLDRLLPTNN